MPPHLWWFGQMVRMLDEAETLWAELLDVAWDATGGTYRKGLRSWTAGAIETLLWGFGWVTHGDISSGGAPPKGLKINIVGMATWYIQRLVVMESKLWVGIAKPILINGHSFWMAPGEWMMELSAPGWWPENFWSCRHKSQSPSWDIVEFWGRVLSRRRSWPFLFLFNSVWAPSWWILPTLRADSPTQSCANLLQKHPHPHTERRVFAS